MDPVSASATHRFPSASIVNPSGGPCVSSVGIETTVCRGMPGTGTPSESVGYLHGRAGDLLQRGQPSFCTTNSHALEKGAANKGEDEGENENVRHGA